MASSLARTLANRANSKLSCGPRTPEGKARSRQNALKHGLTGEGVALPTEDQVEIARRFQALGDELCPSTENGRIYLRRYAFLSVRLERCERYDTSILCTRVRNAEARYDDAQMTEIETLCAMLNRDPMTASRRLQTFPLGIDWMIAYWDELRSDLMIEGRVVWSTNHWAKAEQLMGNAEGNLRVTRFRALTEAVGGFFANLDPSDGEGLDDAARSKYARDEIARIIDAEVALLNQVRESLDHEAMEQDRAESVDRALFDASKEMVLARKYEAATERAMYKAMKDFHAAEAAANQPGESDVQAFEETISEHLASFEENPEPSKVSTRRTPPPTPWEPPTSMKANLSEPSKAVEVIKTGPE